MPYVLNHTAPPRCRVPIPEAHGSRGAQATVDEEEEEEGCVDGLQQRTAGVETRPQNLEMAAQALKRGAEVPIRAGTTASADYARYCQWICKFEFGVMMLRQQVRLVRALPCLSVGCLPRSASPSLSRLVAQRVVCNANCLRSTAHQVTLLARHAAGTARARRRGKRKRGAFSPVTRPSS